AELLLLPARQEVLWRHVVFHGAVLRILDEADDLDVQLPAGPDRYALPDHVRAVPELAREGLVDDGDSRTPGRIGLCEVPSGQERNLQGSEEAFADRVVPGIGVGVRRGFET